MIKHSIGHEPPTLYEYASTQQLNQQQRTTSTTFTTSTTTTTTAAMTPHYNSLNIHHCEQHHITSY